MRKRIKVGIFFDENSAEIVIGGARNISEFTRNYGHPPYRVTYKVVDVPGAILGTPEDWDVLFRQRVREAIKN